jgi:hypothetical protein
MGLRLNGSTSGYSEINPPAVAGDQTFILPGTGGDLLTDGSDLTAQVKTATNASGSAPIYSCRAWVNFNGTGTVAIRASGNVSSITDNGTGDYTVNFATALADSDYSCTATTVQRGGGSAPASNRSIGYGSSATNDVAALYSTTAVRLYIQNGTGGAVDSPLVSVAIFR